MAPQIVQVLVTFFTSGFPCFTELLERDSDALKIIQPSLMPNSVSNFSRDKRIPCDF